LALLTASSSGGPKGAESAVQKIFGHMKACQKAKLLKKSGKVESLYCFLRIFSIIFKKREKHFPIEFKINSLGFVRLLKIQKNIPYWHRICLSNPGGDCPYAGHSSSHILQQS
jgi:hypothetical protein